MPKANITLANGTVVQVDGTIAEIKELLTFYGGGSTTQTHSQQNAHKSLAKKPKEKKDHAADKNTNDPNLNDIISLIKESDDFDQIESQILDRTSLVNRILLPLYIVHEELENKFGLTSGEISKITTDLGVRVSQPNTSTYLSGTASRYVVGDKVRKKGDPVRYKLSRRGVKHIESVLKGTEDAE